MSEGKVYLSKENVGFFVVSLMLLSLSSLSYVPSPEQMSLFVFAIAYVFFALFVFFCSGWWRSVSLSCSFILLLAFLSVLLNFFVSMMADISIDKWFRSFVPILFFSTLLFAPFYLRLLGVRKLYLVLLGSCFFYCFLLFLFNFDKFFEFARLGGRLTFYLQDSVVPYPYVGVILAVLLPGISVMLRAILVSIFLFFVFAVGYKIQIIFLFVFFSFLVCTSSGFVRKAITFLALFLVLLSVFFFAGDYVVQRLSSIGGGGDQVRMLEIKYAWSIFESSPLLGGGLGLDVPLSLTRPTYAEQSELWVSDSVSYIHNFPLYLLMVGGVVFFAFFLLLIQFSGIFSMDNLRSKDKYVQSAVWCVLALIVFFTTSAAFKQIQSIVLLSFFAASLSQLKKQCRWAVHE